MTTTAISFNSPWRPGDNFRVATAIKELFAGFLSDDCLETALATCRFCFQGPKSVGADGNSKNWGAWVRTRMMTRGVLFASNEFACQRQGKQWVSLDSHEAVTVILDHLGLTLQDIYDRYGKPEIGTKYVVDLTTIVRDLAPDCVTNMPELAAVA